MRMNARGRWFVVENDSKSDDTSALGMSFTIGQKLLTGVGTKMSGTGLGVLVLELISSWP